MYSLHFFKEIKTKFLECSIFVSGSDYLKWLFQSQNILCSLNYERWHKKKKVWPFLPTRLIIIISYSMMSVHVLKWSITLLPSFLPTYLCGRRNSCLKKTKISSLLEPWQIHYDNYCNYLQAVIKRHNGEYRTNKLSWHYATYTVLMHKSVLQFLSCFKSCLDFGTDLSQPAFLRAKGLSAEGIQPCMELNPGDCLNHNQECHDGSCWAKCHMLSCLKTTSLNNWRFKFQLWSLVKDCLYIYLLDWSLLILIEDLCIVLGELFLHL